MIYTAQPLIASASAITSAQIALHLAQAEALVWAYSAQRYAVPITPTPPMLESICIDLTCYGVLVKQAILANTLEESPWPDRYKEALDMLKSIASGDLPILTSSATLIAESGNYVSGFSTPKYIPTFSELPDPYHKPDPDKIQALLDER
jgi:phage gp36-like protein